MSICRSTIDERLVKSLQLQGIALQRFPESTSVPRNNEPTASPDDSLIHIRHQPLEFSRAIFEIILDAGRWDSKRCTLSCYEVTRYEPIP